MENNNPAVEPAEVVEDKLEFSLNSKAIDRLKSSAKWSNIFFILVCCTLGLALVFSLFTLPVLEKISYLSNQPMPHIPGFVSVIMTGFAAVICAIIFVPYLFLRKFNTKTKIALENNDSELMVEAFAAQSMYFKVMSIYSIISLAFCAIYMIGMLLVVILVA